MQYDLILTTSPPQSRMQITNIESGAPIEVTLHRPKFRRMCLIYRYIEQSISNVMDSVINSATLRSSSTIMDDEVEEIFAEDNSNGYSGSVTGLQTSLIEQVGEFLIHNGWYLLFGLIGFYIIWEKILRREWEKWKQNYSDRQASARYHKDPDAALSRLQAMEESRRKMQEEYTRASALYVEKLREREEIKRQEKIKEWEKQSKGSSSTSKSKVEVPDVVPQPNHTVTASRFRNTDYNPLTGTGGGSYRPTRRGRSSGGG